jgi:hypothetical protein
MRPATTFAAALFALAIPCMAAVPAAPQGVTASYDMYRNGMRIAVINENFEARDGGYQLASETRAVGLFALVQPQSLRFTSSGRLADWGLQPVLFEGRRGDADPRQVRADFDWQAGRLTIAHDGRTDTVALPPATQDRVSLMYQFMFMGAEKLKRVEFAMTNGRKLDTYRYSVSPEVEIDTALGRLSTLHLVKQHLPDESGAEVWLSPRHRYLPVRVMVREEDGTRYEQFITRLQITDAQP